MSKSRHETRHYVGIEEMATWIGSVPSSIPADSPHFQELYEKEKSLQVAIIAKLRAADKLVVDLVHVMGNLALFDDPEFAAVNKDIDDFEAGS